MNSLRFIVRRLAFAGVAACLTAAAACSDHIAEGDAPTYAGRDTGQGDLPSVHLDPVFPKITFRRPVLVTHAGDGTDRLFIVEQAGRIRVVENDSTTTKAGVFLDIRDKVRERHNEEGLLALAFHPQYRANGELFVYYTASEPRRGVLSRLRVSADDPGAADPASEEVLLEVKQPWGNHNGATVLFGPDGYLYISLGDGGAAGDPHDNAQNLATLLGTVLRIDVDSTEDGRPYAIPDDNPFVGREDARGEIWAYGLRNVWRMSFDRETGDLWAGDVGQDKWEEIDLITRGGNYGWRLREGAHPYRSGDSDVPFIAPVIEYGRKDGISVTGGHVYRGTRNPDLVGAYVYADYVSGRVWALRYENGSVTAHREIMQDRRHRNISSFGEGPDGEIYLCIFQDQTNRKGRIFRLAQ